MKYIKLLFRTKELNTTLPFDQAFKVMTSPNQLVMLMDKDGNWSGDSVNKAELVGTVRDWEKERQEGYNENQIEGPKDFINPYEAIQQFKPKFLQREKGTTKGAESIGKIIEK